MKKNLCILFLIINNVLLVYGTDTRSCEYISHDRIVKKMCVFRAQMLRRSPLATGWLVTKMGFAGIEVASVLCSLSAYWGYPLLNSYVPAKQNLKEDLGKLFVMLVGGFVLKQLYDTVEKEYGQTPTLDWFVKTRAPFYETIRGMRAEADDATLLGVQSDKDQLGMLLEKLIDQTEEICCYMMRTENMLEQKKRVKAYRIRQALISTLEPLYAQASHDLAIESSDFSSIFDMIALAFEQNCLRFAILEGSHWIDPNILWDIVQKRSVSAFI